MSYVKSFDILLQFIYLFIRHLPLTIYKNSRPEITIKLYISTNKYVDVRYLTSTNLL